MNTVSVRELRNHGGDVLDRVASGETVVVSRDGASVAELRPLPRRTVALAELIASRAVLPQIDLDAFRRETDELIDPAV